MILLVNKDGQILKPKPLLSDLIDLYEKHGYEITGIKNEVLSPYGDGHEITLIYNDIVKGGTE